MNPKVATLNGPIVESMPTGPEIRNAKSFLRGATFNKSGEIQPRRFAAAAKETGSSFGDLLKVIARSYGQGQNQEAQRQTDISNAAAAGGGK
jgi:hypothetical protein